MTLRIHPNYAKALEAELSRAGVTAFRYELGGKHPRVVFEHAGRERFWVFPGSPSDCHRVLNMRAGLRRELGTERAPKRSSIVARASVPRPALIEPMPRITVRPDPFAVLERLLRPIEP